MQHITNSILATLLFGFTLKQKHFFQFFFTTMQKFLQKQKLIQNLEKKFIAKIPQK